MKVIVVVRETLSFYSVSSSWSIFNPSLLDLHLFWPGLLCFQKLWWGQKSILHITVCMICIHIQSKLNSRTFHENAKGFSCFCSKICQASWELSAHDQPIPAKAWHAIQACEHCSCTQFGEPNPAECSWHVTKVFSLGISFCRDKLHIDQEMLRTSWN